MIRENTQQIREIISGFSGSSGEPANSRDFYVLKSMWVMMLSEFEASLKDLAESYIDSVKKRPIDQIHICLLLSNFYPNHEENLKLNNILSVHKRNPTDITYANFTGNYVPKYKSSAVEKLFNSLGLFFTESEKTILKNLDGIAQTRDSIAHGNKQIQITCTELKSRLNDIEEVYTMLQNKIPRK